MLLLSRVICSMAMSVPALLLAAPTSGLTGAIECPGCSASGHVFDDDVCFDPENEEIFFYVYIEVFASDGICVETTGGGCATSEKCTVDIFMEWKIEEDIQVLQCIDRGVGPALCVYPPHTADGTVESDGRSQPQACNGEEYTYFIQAPSPCGLLHAAVSVTCTQCGE